MFICSNRWWKFFLEYVRKLSWFHNFILKLFGNSFTVWGHPKQAMSWIAQCLLKFPLVLFLYCRGWKIYNYSCFPEHRLWDRFPRSWAGSELETEFSGNRGYRTRASWRCRGLWVKVCGVTSNYQFTVQVLEPGISSGISNFPMWQRWQFPIWLFWNKTWKLRLEPSDSALPTHFKY